MRAMKARYGEQEGECRFYEAAWVWHLTPADRKPALRGGMGVSTGLTGAKRAR